MLQNIFSNSRFKIKETFIDRNDGNRNKTFYDGDLMAWTFGFQVLILSQNFDINENNNNNKFYNKYNG